MWVRNPEGDLYNLIFVGSIEMYKNADGRWVVSAYMNEDRHPVIVIFDDERDARWFMNGLSSYLKAVDWKQLLEDGKDFDWDVAPPGRAVPGE